MGRFSAAIRCCHCVKSRLIGIAAFVYFVVLRHKPAVFSVHDVYPDVGITLGIFRHKSVISIVGGLERYCLKH